MQGLKYVSWADTTGYAIAAKSYIRALSEAGVAVTWTPMVGGRGGYRAMTEGYHPDCEQLARVCNRDIAYDTVLIHTVPEYYPQWIDQERRRGAKQVLGYTVWELEHLPDHWPRILNQLDGVLVPCRWNVEVFRRSGVHVPIHVVPHLSQFEGMPDATDDDRAALRARLGCQAPIDGRFVFYTIGFWSHRKAPYLALEAYWKAFDANDPVLMVVKTSVNDITRVERQWKRGFRRGHPSPRRDIRERARRFPKSAPIAVIAEEDLGDGEMRALHEMGDCLVSLARTEGWGLGMFEAARLGKPVVATGYGGQRDFLDPECSYLVDYEMVRVEEPVWSDNYRQSDRWADPSVDQAARYLREIFASPEEARMRAGKQAGRIREVFSPEPVVQSFLRALT